MLYISAKIAHVSFVYYIKYLDTVSSSKLVKFFKTCTIFSKQCNIDTRDLYFSQQIQVCKNTLLYDKLIQQFSQKKKK